MRAMGMKYNDLVSLLICHPAKLPVTGILLHLMNSCFASPAEAVYSAFCFPKSTKCRSMELKQCLSMRQMFLYNEMRNINAVFLRGVGIDKPLIASCGSSKNGKGERGALNFFTTIVSSP